MNDKVHINLSAVGLGPWTPNNILISFLSLAGGKIVLFGLQRFCLICFVKYFMHLPWTINNEKKRWLFRVRKVVYKKKKIQCSFIFLVEHKVEPWCLLSFQNNTNKKVI